MQRVSTRSMSMRAESKKKGVSGACSYCRSRRVMRSNHKPCVGCLSTNLTCAYDSPGRERKKNKVIRAASLNGLQNTQTPDAPAPSPTPASSEWNHPPLTALCPSKTSFAEVCIDAYINRVHAVVPLLSRQVLETELQLAKTSLASRQLILAFCAYVANFENAFDEAQTDRNAYSGFDFGRQSLDEALQVQDPKRMTDPNPRSTLISFFLYGAYTSLGEDQKGWFYLREATTLFIVQKNDVVDWYDQSANSSLFWVLLISERSYSIKRSRPITLQVTSSSPKPSDANAPVLHLFASIYQPLDEAFFAVWNGSSKICSKDWLLELERDVRTALPPALEVSNEEMANLRVSHFWLRIKLWELFPRFGFLSTESEHECLTFRYPITVATDLTILAMKLPIAGFQAHGIGMTEKVFDIACAVADILPFISVSTSQLELGPIDYLTQVILLLAKLPSGTNKFVPLLLAKINELSPELISTLCAATQISFPASNDSTSLDTRFVYEEEVGRGLYTSLRRTN